ncbi:MAG: Wadjet anti-phage system protein JetA family protein [Coprococcus sp.]
MLRQAFKTELVISRDELTAMLVNSMESNMTQVDFSEEAQEMGAEVENQNGLPGKAHLLIRKLRDTGWLELEYRITLTPDTINVVVCNDWEVNIWIFYLKMMILYFHTELAV